MLNRSIALLLTVSLLAGCGEVAIFGHTVGDRHSELKSDPNVGSMSADANSTAVPSATLLENQAVATPVIQVVNAVTLVLTPRVTAKVADSRFNSDALLGAIKAELKARNLLDETELHTNGTAEVSIDNFVMRPTSNAVVFGYIITDGMLGGDVRIRDADGNELQHHRIDAKLSLKTAVDGDSSDSLGPLYRRFAVLAGDRLAGTPSTPLTIDQIPR